MGNDAVKELKPSVVSLSESQPHQDDPASGDGKAKKNGVGYCLFRTAANQVEFLHIPPNSG